MQMPKKPLPNVPAVEADSGNSKPMLPPTRSASRRPSTGDVSSAQESPSSSANGTIPVQGQTQAGSGAKSRIQFQSSSMLQNRFRSATQRTDEANSAGKPQENGDNGLAIPLRLKSTAANVKNRMVGFAVDERSGADGASRTSPLKPGTTANSADTRQNPSATSTGAMRKPNNILASVHAQIVSHPPLFSKANPWNENKAAPAGRPRVGAVVAGRTSQSNTTVLAAERSWGVSMSTPGKSSVSSDISGYLSIKKTSKSFSVGKLRGFQRRYCIMRNSKIFCFKDQGSDVSDVIDLKACTVSVNASGDTIELGLSGEVGFLINPTPASTAAEWIRHIYAANGSEAPAFSPSPSAPIDIKPKLMSNRQGENGGTSHNHIVASPPQSSSSSFPTRSITRSTPSTASPSNTIAAPVAVPTELDKASESEAKEAAKKPEHAGWVMKKKRKPGVAESVRARPWQKRFACLKNGKLFYYREMFGEYLGSITLAGCTARSLNEKTLEIALSDKSAIYSFYFSEEEDARLWNRLIVSVPGVERIYGNDTVSDDHTSTTLRERGKSWYHDVTATLHGTKHGKDLAGAVPSAGPARRKNAGAGGKAGTIGATLAPSSASTGTPSPLSNVRADGRVRSNTAYPPVETAGAGAGGEDSSAAISTAKLNIGRARSVIETKMAKRVVPE